MFGFSPISAAATGFAFMVRRPFWVLRFIIAAALVTKGAMWLAQYLPMQAISGAIALTALMIMASAIANAAVLRNLVRGEDGGFATVRLGGDELRLAGVIGVIAIGLAFVALTGIILVLGAINQGAFFGELAFGADRAQWGSWMFGGLALALTLGTVVYLGIRLSLSPAATIGQRRVGIATSWRLTRGRFAELIQAYALNITLALLFFSALATAAFGVWWVLDQAGVAPVQFDVAQIITAIKAFVAMDATGGLKLVGAAAAPIIAAQAMANALAVIFPAGVGANAYLCFLQFAHETQTA